VIADGVDAVLRAVREQLMLQSFNGLTSNSFAKQCNTVDLPDAICGTLLVTPRIRLPHIGRDCRA
jgi:hypothetical protein